MSHLFAWPLAQDNQDDANRLHQHCDRLGISPFSMDNSHLYFKGQVIVRHPLLDEDLLFAADGGRLWPKRAIAESLIKMCDAKWVQSKMAKQHKLLHLSSFVPVLDTPSSEEQIQDWLASCAAGAVVAVEASANHTTLTLCKDASRPAIVLFSSSFAMLRNHTKLRLICADATTAQEWKAVQVGQTIHTRFPGLSDKAGLAQYCEWFLGLKASALDSAAARCLALKLLWDEIHKH